MTRGDATSLATDDPDAPSAAVGSWRAPDLGRLGLPPAASVFAIAAVLVGAMRVSSLVERLVRFGGSEWLPLSVAELVVASGVILLPAALLQAAPQPWRTHALLFGGLILAAAATVIDSAMAFWPYGPGNDGWLGSGVFLAWRVIVALAPLLTALGLMRLRTRRPARRTVVLLVAVAAVNLAVSIAIAQRVVIDATGLVSLFVAPVTLAFALWVPMAAWLEHEPSRPFWTLLAIQLPLAVFAQLLLVPELYAGSALFQPAWTLQSAAGAIAVVLGVVAYGTRMPARGTSAAGEAASALSR